VQQLDGDLLGLVGEEPADDREVGQAGAGEHHARQPLRRGAQRGIGERHGG